MKLERADHQSGTGLSPFLLTRADMFGRPVCRLGLASRGETMLAPDDVLHALDRGINWKC
jgi:hypothetical protein